MSLDYGWTPQQIGEMTLAQIHVYYIGLDDPGTPITTKPSEAEAIKKRVQKQKHAFVKRWINDRLV